MALGDTTYRGVLFLASAVAVKAVTPSDTDDLPDGMCRGFMINGVGTLSIIDGAGEGPVAFAAPAVGVVHWIAARRIRSTGTSATGILALY